jgi:hypothetical protein
MFLAFSDRGAMAGHCTLSGVTEGRLTDTTRVGADDYARFGRHEERCKYFLDTTNAGGVNLTHIDGIQLQQLLEGHLERVSDV